MGMVGGTLSGYFSPGCRLSGRTAGGTVKRLFCLVLTLIAFSLLTSGSASCAEQEGQDNVVNLKDRVRQEKLWAEAQAFLEAQNVEQAALYFKHYWQTYPQSPRAGDALWQAALLYKQQAFQSEDPDWSKVKDLFRDFIVDFPDSPRVADAYYEIGSSYYQMGFYREALNHYSLLMKEYPGYPLENEVIYMRGRAFLEVDKPSLASAEFARLKDNKDRMIRLQGELGQVAVHFYKGEWHDALGILKRVHRRNPDYYLQYPKILKDMGVASIRVGNDDEGRDYILRYLNIREEAQLDAEAYFEVADSFLQEGMIDSARVFYELVIAKSDRHDKYAILSQFRLAQYNAVNLDKMSEKERLAFFKKNGDKPFQQVLDSLYSDPLAQEARYALLKRYVERQEWDLAYNLGKFFLRFEAPEKERAFVNDELGKILLGKIAKLLAAEKYEKIRDLYEKEFITIAAYKKADLLMLIGEGYERSSLYDQASVIYYRALGLEIEEEQKVGLYFRRAEVYLANNDLKSAQRLLKYLRRLYQDQPAIAEVNWLSARLRQKQKRPEDALEFYKMAVESGSQQDKKGVYAADYLHQLFALSDLERVADLVAMFHEGQWLPDPQIQYWYGRLGLVLSQEGKLEAAAAIFSRALADDLPETSPEAQPIHLHFGDVLMAQKKHKQAIDHYRLAKSGVDDRIVKLAEARLNEYQIRGVMADVEAMF